jgi:hypothetical protein
MGLRGILRWEEREWKVAMAMVRMGWEEKISVSLYTSNFLNRTDCRGGTNDIDMEF